MNQKAIDALKRINADNLENSVWGIVEDGSVADFIEIEITNDRKLDGTWLYVWQSSELNIEFWQACGKPDEVIKLHEYDETILFYKL